MFFVYVLQSQKINRYYIGSTKNVTQRLEQHNAGMSKSTRNFRPWLLVHAEAFEMFSEARKREVQIKSWKNPAYLETTLDISKQLI